MTPGEKRFAQRLESHLEDDYLCWYDVPIGRRSQHPDFIVLHPSRGLLILEVKDWKLDTIQRIDRRSTTLLTANSLKEVPSPLEQARQYTHAVVKQLESDPQLVYPSDHSLHGRLSFPFGHGVVLTHIARGQFDATDLGEVLPPERVICKDEMTETVEVEAFQQRLWDMFTVHFHHRLSLPQIDRIRWHLFPELRINQAPLFAAEDDTSGDTPTPADTLPDLIRIMDLQQEQLARSLGEGHRVIHGTAGAGKTLILVYRCLHLAQALRKPILVLCYNRTLARRLQTMMAEKGLGNQVQVRGFHSWCYAQLSAYHVPLPQSNGDRDAYYENMIQHVIHGVDRGQIPAAQYGAVMIDEGHDFQPHWFRLAVQMVDPDTDSVLVLYDDAQSIYGRGRRSFSFSSAGIHARGRTTILRVNYRNTREILHVATEFAHEQLTPQEAEEDGIPLIVPQSAGRSGPLPTIVRLPNVHAELDHIANYLRQLHERGHPWRDMAVLHRRARSGGIVAEAFKKAGIPHEWLGSSHQRRHFDPATNTVKILTMHSSKGLEFPVVAIPGLGYMPYKDKDASQEARVLYVAMTRAMEELLMTGHRESAFLRQVSTALENTAA